MSAISAGSRGAPLLAAASDAPIPEITAGRSAIQALTEEAPQVVSQILALLEDLGEVTGPENQARVQTILANLATSSDSLTQALDNVAAVSGDISTAVSGVSDFAAGLESISQAVSRALDVTDDMVASVDALSQEATQTLQTGTAALEAARDAAEVTRTFVSEDLGSATGEVRETAALVRDRLTTLGDEASRTMADFAAAGRAATDRLEQAQQTLTAADEMLGRAGDTLASVDTLVAGPGAELVAEARQAVAEASRTLSAVGDTAEADLPAIAADMRSAAQQVDAAAARVGQDLSAASGRLATLTETAQSTLDQVQETFATADETLTALDRVLAEGETAAAAAGRAFDGADRLIADDVAPLAADLRDSVAGLNTALDQVAADLPGVTGDLRKASAEALSAFETLERTVTASGQQVQSFASQGLPQYTRLAMDTRALIARLEDLVRQIERDPARFFLNSQTPEFQR